MIGSNPKNADGRHRAGRDNREGLGTEAPRLCPSIWSVSIQVAAYAGVRQRQKTLRRKQAGTSMEISAEQNRKVRKTATGWGLRRGLIARELAPAAVALLVATFAG